MCHHPSVCAGISTYVPSPICYTIAANFCINTSLRRHSCSAQHPQPVCDNATNVLVPATAHRPHCHSPTSRGLQFNCIFMLWSISQFTTLPHVATRATYTAFFPLRFLCHRLPVPGAAEPRRALLGNCQQGVRPWQVQQLLAACCPPLPPNPTGLK